MMAPRKIRSPPLIGRNGLADWSLESAIKRHVARVLEYCNGDLAWAASELRVNASTLYRWRRDWSGIRNGQRPAVFKPVMLRRSVKEAVQDPGSSMLVREGQPCGHPKRT